MRAAERGVTTVADRVAVKIARQAATEALTDGGRVLRGTASQAGPGFDIAVEVALPLSPDVGSQAVSIQEHVGIRSAHLTGRKVAAPLIRVRQLTAAAPGPGPQPPAVAGEQAPRTWSQRRLSAGCLAVTITASSCLLLWNALAPHLLVEAGSLSPYEALVRFARRHSRIGGWAGATAALGMWLVILALTPGHRRLLTLRTPAPVRAGLSRSGAAHLVGAALADVPGLRVRSVRCTARTVHVRSELTFGEAEPARETATLAISHAIEAMALRRNPRIRLDLTDTGSSGPPPAPDHRIQAEDHHA
ncbi:DUF6286 domain-containing protein [Streptomyces sp. NPDC058525]|uniref:DUF6286 domain-containing protein n=1 Tax=Streptomyces sp. NPDC058525 TaxID=3346538 RepID=UPI003659E972